MKRNAAWRTAPWPPRRHIQTAIGESVLFLSTLSTVLNPPVNELNGTTRCHLAPSRDRMHKERALRHRRFKQLLARLRELAGMRLKRDALLIKSGRNKAQAGWEFSLVGMRLPKPPEPVNAQTFGFHIHKPKLREACRAKAAQAAVRSPQTGTPRPAAATHHRSKRPPRGASCSANLSDRSAEKQRLADLLRSNPPSRVRSRGPHVTPRNVTNVTDESLDSHFHFIFDFF